MTKLSVLVFASPSFSRTFPANIEGDLYPNLSNIMPEKLYYNNLYVSVEEFCQLEARPPKSRTVDEFAMLLLLEVSNDSESSRRGCFNSLLEVVFAFGKFEKDLFLLYIFSNTH